MPLAVEYQFAVNIDGIILGGKIDRLDKLEDGVSIVDYKTNQNLFTVDHLEQDLQLTFYQLAVETLWKMPVKRLTLYHLRSNTPCSCEGRQPERLEEARQIILDVADGIKQEIFPARENQFCDFCDFPEHCPYHKHKFAPEEPAQSETGNILQGKAASEAVERYASLQGQKKELELQLEELKCLICEYCQAQGFNRLYGENHTLTYKMVERTEFNAERVKAFLEPIGLWPQVLRFDSARVKALLEGEGIKPEWRKKLAEMKEVTSTFPMLSVKKLKDNEGHLDQ